MNADLVFGIHAVDAFLQRAPQDVLELFVMMTSPKIQQDLTQFASESAKAEKLKKLF